jgi:broad specificity phosphatase PhoE
MGKFSTISFFRHGDAVGPIGQPSHLTELGRTQAQRRRELLGNPHYDVGFCSSMVRTRETLDVLTGTNYLPVISVPELNYRDGIEDRIVKDAIKKFGNSEDFNFFATKLDVAHTFLNFGARAWEQILSRLNGFLLNFEGVADAIVVGHGILLGFVVMAAFPNMKPEDVAKLGFNNCEGARLTFNEFGHCVKMEMLCD